MMGLVSSSCHYQLMISEENWITSSEHDYNIQSNNIALTSNYCVDFMCEINWLTYIPHSD